MVGSPPVVLRGLRDCSTLKRLLGAPAETLAPTGEYEFRECPPAPPKPAPAPAPALARPAPATHPGGLSTSLCTVILARTGAAVELRLAPLPVLESCELRRFSEDPLSLFKLFLFPIDLLDELFKLFLFPIDPPPEALSKLLRRSIDLLRTLMPLARMLTVTHVKSFTYF